MNGKENLIRHFNGFDRDAYTYYPVLIIGAGESGIALGCRLKEALGFDQFRIFDRQGGPGGTCESSLNFDTTFQISSYIRMIRYNSRPASRSINILLSLK